MVPKAPDPKPGATQSKRPFAWWLVILVMLMLWNAGTFLFARSQKSTTLPYTTFLTQVRNGNVSKVKFSGDQINGQFVKPYKPEPQPSPKASPPSYAEFQTIFPQIEGDPRLLPLLESHRVEVDVAQPPSPWLSALIGWLPMLLLLGFFVWTMRSAAQKGGPMGALGFGRANPKLYSADRPKVTFDDVAGADEAKLELQEEVDFLRHPAKYHNAGARIPKGILLVGPPGIGKTLLARAVAGEANVPFFSLSASEFVEMFVGVGASRVRDLFKQAKESAPAIVFIDEIDAVGRRRGAGVGAVNDEREQTLNQLLGELDGFDPRVNIIVLAATNRPDVLDPALLRPGRFDREVTVPLPDRRGREGILRIHTRNLHLVPDVDLAILAASTIGMSGADLENLCNEAALGAARHDRTTVSMADFEEALDRVRLGAAHPRLVDPEDLRVIAYHEAGHTVVAWLTQGADPVHKVTVVAHGMALGVTQQLPAKERLNLSAAYLKARLAVMLGGRTAEEIVFDEVTTGAENDLVEATSLARQMVTTWGMGNVGLLAFKSNEVQPFLGYELTQNRDYSEAMAAHIEEGMQALIDQAHAAAHGILTQARAQLDELAALLCKEETVGADVLTQILGPRKTKLAVAGYRDGVSPEK